MKCAACNYEFEENEEGEIIKGDQDFKPIFFDTPNARQPDGTRVIDMNELSTFYLNKGFKVYSRLHMCPKCGTVKINL
jgi:rubredoxin